MKPERIAVIVSTYNKPDDLRAVIASYALQRDQNFTLCIADDGSDERTARCIAEARETLSAPVRHIRHEDKGFRLAEIRNRAIAACPEPYILITDGDCLAPPDLIAAHRRLARRGYFVTGSRILLQAAISDEIRQGRIDIRTALSLPWLARQRAKGQLNRFWPLLVPPSLGAPSRKLTGLRGCHMAFWRDDLLAVNGYDQGYQGWGREDSDLAARLFHAGIPRRPLRGAPLLHLWHPEAPREALPANERRLAECLREQRRRAPEGIEELRP